MICILYDSPLPKMQEEMALSFNLRSQHIQKQAALTPLWFLTGLLKVVFLSQLYQYWHQIKIMLYF